MLKKKRTIDYKQQLLEEFYPMTWKEISKSLQLIWKGVSSKVDEGFLVQVRRSKGGGFHSIIGFAKNREKIEEIQKQQSEYIKGMREAYHSMNKYR